MAMTAIADITIRTMTMNTTIVTAAAGTTIATTIMAAIAGTTIGRSGLWAN